MFVCVSISIDESFCNIIFNVCVIFYVCVINKSKPVMKDKITQGSIYKFHSM